MIITEPNAFVAEVHDRMPVLLTEPQFAVTAFWPRRVGPKAQEPMTTRRRFPAALVRRGQRRNFRHGSMGREWGCRLLGRRGNLIFLQVCQG